MVSKRWKNTGLIPRSRSPVRSGSSSRRGSLQSLGCSCGDRSRDVMRKARLLCHRRKSWRSRIGLCSYRELFVLDMLNDDPDFDCHSLSGSSLDDYISIPSSPPRLLRIRQQPKSEHHQKSHDAIERSYSCLCCADKDATK